MSATLSNKAPAFGPSAPERKRRSPIGWIIFACVLLLGGAGFWYYFFGKKPKVVMTVALPAAAAEGPTGVAFWPLGNGELLVLANGELKLIALPDRAVKWTTKVPAGPKVDPKWRAAVNKRFIRLQQWADDLTRKRAVLKTPQDTKAFNEEAAKYQTELAAARAEVTNSTEPAAPVAEKGVAKKGDKTAKADEKKTAEADEKAPKIAAPAADKKAAAEGEPAKLKAIVTPEMELLAARLKRREAQMKQLGAAITKKKKDAKTEIQMSVVADDERRLAGLNAEQKNEQELLTQLQGVPAAPVVQKKVEEEPEVEPLVEEAYVRAADPFATVVGAEIWLFDQARMISFDRASGTVKSDMQLAGPILKSWGGNGEVYAVASAGVEARQITKITASTGPLSLFAPAGKVDNYLELSGGESVARIQPHRTEFSGSMLRADIKLIEKKVVARDTIRAGSDESLVETINHTPGNSEDEVAALAKLMANDAKRLLGETKEFVDGSTYEVTLTRPLETGVLEWKGNVIGRVELFSTATRDLIVAGTKLLAFDHSNRKLWEASLGATLPRPDPDDEVQNCLEIGERLYFADGAFLTAFEASSGKVLWRLPSIGIRKLQVDGDGKLYVHTLNLPTEALVGAYEDVTGEVEPVALKINPDNGQIEWQAEKYGDLWVSGGDIYALREGRRPEDVEEQVFDPGKMAGARVKIYKLSRSKGAPIWEWFQPRHPEAVYADGKTVGLLFHEELQVLHSIAW